MLWGRVDEQEKVRIILTGNLKKMLRRQGEALWTGLRRAATGPRLAVGFNPRTLNAKRFSSRSDG